VPLASYAIQSYRRADTWVCPLPCFNFTWGAAPPAAGLKELTGNPRGAEHPYCSLCTLPTDQLLHCSMLFATLLFALLHFPLQFLQPGAQLGKMFQLFLENPFNTFAV